MRRPDHSPTRRPLERAIRPALVVLWCGAIFAASARPDLRIADDDVLDTVLRKAAHAFAYGTLLLLTLRTFVGEQLAPRRAAAWALTFTMLYAISDEYHQTFVPGRVGHASDVAIDTAGALAALGLAALLHRRHQHRQEQLP